MNLKNLIIKEIDKFLIAIQFLTIIKIKEVKWDENFAAKSVVYFPLVGIIIGFILYLIYFSLPFIFPITLISILLIITEIILTGGLHLDGFIDTIDGLFGGKNKEERLKIMKDPHPGSFGIIAVVVLIIFKFLLLVEILGKFSLILILMPALGRYSMIIPMAIYPYAKNNGTAKFTKFVRTKEILIATLFMILFSLIIFLNLYSLSKTLIILLIIFITTFIFSLILSKYITSKIGGMTGDTYGFINEISEIFTLLLIYITIL